ncbi:cell division protein FtsW (lipid II flippase) [Caldalkalibacillus uzonensis]|uniref:Cell division protein FtsW (Lipid II flippase) n=1 Tax=Caldalkalibacillus uzonensis TaxID=353224 RepID=A0ABU0CP64_9BACI|nr:tripartite tricarboxylate transporter TctB family protein [Caldalkalibacillus uzonensis]MDQ0338189.1 cell division protein FtsW (lipid II flippase) [Caldalkalibacillus uzonensis]
MKSNLVIAIVTIVFSFFFLIQAIQIPDSRAQTAVPPNFWPTFILSLMLVLGIILLAKTLIEARMQKRESGQTETEQTVEEEEHVSVYEPELKYPFRLWAIILSLTVFIITLPYLGFILASLLFILVVSWVMGVKKWIPLLGASVISTAVFVFIFTKLLHLPLPRGVGFFRELSLFFY